MSRGLGAVEQGVLAALRKYHLDIYWATGSTGGRTNGGNGMTLAQIVYHGAKPEGEARWRNPTWRHAADSTRRALKTLERKGSVKAIPGSLYSKATCACSAGAPQPRSGGSAKQRQRKERARMRNAGEKRTTASSRLSVSTRASTICRGPRDKLAKLLGMLGSEHEGEILAAARMVEVERKRLELTWEQLLSR